ncbi:MAG: hypothetical protein WHS64_08875 [Fervidobacterium sp.]|uniref:hypothetical protein n=1 Tax=Fervidobacterium sp. TaxID=1871331 RepID=UPI0022071EC4|nr:hypothetical protein IB67_10285 [Fervidobacterium riparium]
MLMQNGHEADNVRVLAKEAGIPFDGTDFKTMARIIAETGDINYLTQTRSNWFIFLRNNSEENWKLYVASYRINDPLHIYGNLDNTFYIASEKLESEHETKAFKGIIKFKVTSERLIPLN